MAEIAVLWNRKGQKYSSEKQDKMQIKGNITRDILKYLDYRSKTVDEIWTEMLSKGEGKTLPEVLNELVEACMQGKVAQVAGSYFIKPGL